jgi:hypothetical protein
MLRSLRLPIAFLGFVVALAILVLGSSLLNKWLPQPDTYAPSTGSPPGSLANDPLVYLPDTGLVQLTSPISSTSYYLKSINSLVGLDTQLGNWDRNHSGTQDHLVILDYGYPVWQQQGLNNYIYGIQFVNDSTYTFHDLNFVINNVVSFAHDYYTTVNSWDPQSHLRIVVSVNNCCWYETGLYDRFAGHGVAWANAVNTIRSQISTYASQVSVIAGMDIEQHKPDKGGDPYATYVWLNAYRDNSSCYPTPGMDNTTEGCFYNFGTMQPAFSTGGCHTSAPTDPTDPSYNWNYCDVWYASWGVTKGGYRFARPLPEIYHGYASSLPWGSDANAWQALNVFSYQQMSAGPMFFVGTLTERLSCNDACDQGNNYPWEGFQLLSRALASNTITRQAMRWSVDITLQP